MAVVVAAETAAAEWRTPPGSRGAVRREAGGAIGCACAGSGAVSVGGRRTSCLVVCQYPSRGGDGKGGFLLLHFHVQQSPRERDCMWGGYAIYVCTMYGGYVTYPMRPT